MLIAKYEEVSNCRGGGRVKLKLNFPIWRKFSMDKKVLRTKI